jgi:hypothetical protein
MPQRQRDQARVRTSGIPQRAREIAGEPHRIGDQLGNEQFRRSTVSSLIPRQEPRKKRVYRRAQNGEVGSVTKASVPASSGRG